MSLAISLVLLTCSVPIFLTVPSLNDNSLGVKAGDSILIPVTNYVTALHLRLDSHLLCTGQAMTLNCNSIQPNFEWKNISRRAYIYMTAGSVFNFTLESFRTLTRLDSSFVWIFQDYQMYAGALSNNFQGYDCGSPGDGNWCYYISPATSISYITYNITKDSYYHLACYPDNNCPLIERLQMYQGSYSFNSFDSQSHSYFHLNEEEPVKVVIRSQFDYSHQESKCILVYISDNYQSSCRHGDITNILISDQKHQVGLLVFPGLFIFGTLLCIIVLSMCFCQKLKRSNCNFKQTVNYRLVNVST